MVEVGDCVKVLGSVDGKTSVKFERGRVIYIGRRVLVEFFRNICGHDGNGIGKNRHCWMVDFEKMVEL